MLEHGFQDGQSKAEPECGCSAAALFDAARCKSVAGVAVQAEDIPGRLVQLLHGADNIVGYAVVK